MGMVCISVAVSAMIAMYVISELSFDTEKITAVLKVIASICMIIGVLFLIRHGFYVDSQYAKASIVKREVSFDKKTLLTCVNETETKLTLLELEGCMRRSIQLD